MSLAPRLDLRQSQSLVMTPQLQQAIKLLALSNLEVEAFIGEELERNPLLETASDEPAGVTAEMPDQLESGPADGTDAAMSADELIARGDGLVDAPLDADYATETFHHDAPSDAMPGMDGGLAVSGAGGGPAGEAPDIDALGAETLSLQDHLLGQARLALSGTSLLIAQHLIDQIDEAGYLAAPLLDVAYRLGVPLAAVEEVLAIVQMFEPTGVAARSLAECLALQAREADRYDPCMAKLIDNLDLLARGALPQLKRLCQVDDEDLADMIRELRNYDPKPGLRHGGERVQSVQPDIFVAATRAGWAIELNQATLPKVLVNRSYYVELAGGRQEKAARAWLNECLQSANWLVKALDQRARTIIKVAGELVKQQDGFFRHGVSHLRPLTLRQVADAIGMHESTVSRVTSNKYLSCERGLFELKFFFTSAIASADGGEAASAEAVKSHIRALIAGEGDAILSDDSLVDLLNARGFGIARRTVAKYREALGLGSSVQRRRARALAMAG